MASVKAFNQTLQEFLDDLKGTFPEEKAIRTMIMKFEAGTTANNRMALNSLMPHLTKHAQMISSRNEQLFLDPNNNVIPDIDLRKLWMSDISDNTRNVIWNYMNTLLMLGTTISSLPQNMLAQIETMAQTCVDEMQANNVQPDQGLMQAQQSMMQSGMFQNMFQQMCNQPNAPMGQMNAQLTEVPNTPSNTPTDKPKRKKNKK
tara:strand:+ start:1454 stop:2062 length:609 start_codon:yes stop_codon:yes gene_type:complete